MVSQKTSDACYPNIVKMGRDFRDGTLVLNVIHGKEMQVEYEKAEIIDKINSFFGYNCISNITLKIVQNEIITKNKSFPKIKNASKIKEKMNKVNSKELKNSLNNFLKAYNERSK